MYYSANIIDDSLVHKVLVEILHSNGYDTGLTSKDTQGLDGSQLKLRTLGFLYKDWEQGYENLDDYRLNPYLLVE